MFENGLSLTMLPSGYHESKADTYYNLRKTRDPGNKAEVRSWQKNNKAETQPTMGLAPRKVFVRFQRLLILSTLFSISLACNFISFTTMFTILIKLF